MPKPAHLIASTVFSMTALAGAVQAQQPGGIEDNMPAFQQALKARLTFPMAWSPQVKDLAAWRAAGRAKVWDATLQAPDRTPFAPQVLAEQDRGAYTARDVAFNLTQDSRVRALMLVPKGAGPFPAVLMLHDHGGKFDIGKEKVVAPMGDAARSALSQAWAAKYFGGRHLGDELARRGYVVLAVDALGWGDRGTLTGDTQQALAANSFNLGTSLAGIHALDDVRAAEFLAAQPQVDKRRVAAFGFSMGAYRAWQVAALSDAVTAVVAANWMATTEGLMVAGNNQLKGSSAWHMLHPGLVRYLDYPDVASLAAPKPALFIAGASDPLFPAASAQTAFNKMAQVWKAWQAPERFETRVLPHGHVFPLEAQEGAFEWLDKQFSAGPANSPAGASHGQTR
ncbi:prolyl oligopeptidase family serine peptidase [Duganella sp. FT92W]|uniref:Prolyl oligopeptidase family serine peptidase n=1 Tax=Pseudoduganella rivuli TaxID=2666085 RepID=A0A7X2LVZ1_9BURK|nr:alpha/beta fold hydrolase [Pseudoduganella rivuli]MRV75468.1 prolyl oligopeptidase family serine peptidase [Pseudoduganella rivuli]